MTKEILPVHIQRTVCATDPNHSREKLLECPVCHAYYCEGCLEKHKHVK
jgi:hypothetical protein